MAISVALEHLPDRLLHVAVRKNGLDDDAPWWQRWYERVVFQRFLRFSAKYFHVPAPYKREPDGSYTFLEHIGIATDPAYAASMVEPGANYRLKTLPLNGALPVESVDWEPDIWPNSDNPNRYANINVARMKAVPCEHLCQETKIVEERIEQVDRIRAKLRLSPDL